MLMNGTIHFANNVSEEFWQRIIQQFDLQPTSEVEINRPEFGGAITVKEPPNLLALFHNNASESPGVIRCSRMFFDGGVGETAEISFQGRGKKFEQLVREISEFVDGELTLQR